MKFIRMLKSDISVYRDYEITHEKSPRTMKATMFDMGAEKDGTRIINTKVYPTESDVQTQNKSLHELAEVLEVYIPAVLAWIGQSRDRCCLLLENRKLERKRR